MQKTVLIPFVILILVTSCNKDNLQPALDLSQLFQQVQWSGKARKIIRYPDIDKVAQAAIVPVGKYSIPVSLTFDREGNTISVLIFSSSGYSQLDTIIYSHLKEFKVEPISENRIDKVKFTISINITKKQETFEIIS